MNDKIDNKILYNFSKGKYSYNDYLKVKDWVNQIEENEEVKKQLFAQWKELSNVNENKDDSLHHIFEKIQYTILLEEKKKHKKTEVLNFFRQAAAVLFLPLLAFFLWYYISSKTINQEQQITQGWVEINAPEGARVEFFLPDSSQGWLNSGSKLRYPAIFDKNRKVELSGEAYFDVKHHSQSDFVVSLPDMDLKVLGTKFNVSAFPDDAFTNVVLIDGKVEINGKAGVFNHILLPNKKLTFNRDSKSLKQATVDADRYSAWKEGYLIIEDESLGQVIGRVERWYNADIIIQDDALNNYRFRATFRDEPLEEVLRLMAKTTPIIYKIEKREMDSNGTLKRKKVTIKLKR